MIAWDDLPDAALKRHRFSAVSRQNGLISALRGAAGLQSGKWPCNV
jgi:hypothetical protein